MGRPNYAMGDGPTSGSETEEPDDAPATRTPSVPRDTPPTRRPPPHVPPPSAPGRNVGTSNGVLVLAMVSFFAAPMYVNYRPQISVMNKFEAMEAAGTYQTSVSCMVNLRSGFNGPLAKRPEELLLPLCECLACTNEELFASHAMFGMADSFWAMIHHTSVAGSGFCLKQTHHKGYKTIFEVFQYKALEDDLRAAGLKPLRRQDFHFGAVVASVVGFSDASITTSAASAGYATSFDAMERICQLVRHGLATSQVQAIFEAVLGSHQPSNDWRIRGPLGAHARDRSWMSPALSRAVDLIERARPAGTGENSAVYIGRCRTRDDDTSKRRYREAGISVPADIVFYSLHQQQFHGKASSNAPRIVWPFDDGRSSHPCRTHKEALQQMLKLEMPVRVAAAEALLAYEKWMSEDATKAFQERAHFAENNGKERDMTLPVPHGILRRAYEVHNIWPLVENWETDVLAKTSGYFPAPSDQSAAATVFRAAAFYPGEDHEGRPFPLDSPLLEAKTKSVIMSRGVRGNKDGQAPSVGMNSATFMGGAEPRKPPTKRKWGQNE